MDRTVKRVIIFISIILISVVSLIVAVLTSNGGLMQNKFLANFLTNLLFFNKRTLYLHIEKQ